MFESVSPYSLSATFWCTLQTLRPPSGIPARTTIASVPAWRSTACTLRATRRSGGGRSTACDDLEEYGGVRLLPGDGVSYGLTFLAEAPMFAATVPVGYAEGYRRALSGRAEALIRGQRRPLWGEPAMDACVFGVERSCRGRGRGHAAGGQGEGALRPKSSAHGTINYEITTGIDPAASRGATKMFEDLNWKSAARRSAVVIAIYLGLSTS